MVSHCKSCGAEITWATTATGARMPLDARPQKRVVLEPGHRGPLARVVDTYAPHHATCPHAAKHRRPRT